MAIQAEICLWYKPWPGHAALKIWDVNIPDNGYYISSDYREFIQLCIKSGATMDYAKCFQQELQKYGNKCNKMRLPEGSNKNLTLITAQPFEQKYSIDSNNCAHMVARLLRLFDYIHNDRFENVGFLTPSEFKQSISALATSTIPVNELEYAIASINSDLEQLDALAGDLKSRGYKEAEQATRKLISAVKTELMRFIFLDNKSPQEWAKTQQAIQSCVAESDPILSKHRGYKKIIGNIFLGILMLGVIYGIAIAIKGLITGKYLFFNDTNTSKVSNRIAGNVQNAHFAA